MTTAEKKQSQLDKQQTQMNYQSEILEARVVANHGDPGIDEDYHFDILSRYVIVMIESYKRVLTADKYPSMIAMVKRPKQLWIEAVGDVKSSTTDQNRKDAAENISVGVAGSFSVNGISRIYPSYKLGEIIKIKRLPKQAQASEPTQNRDIFNFSSAFSKWDSTTQNYASWHSEGSSLPYFSTPDMKASLQKKTISPTASNNLYYQGVLHKLQYEAFMLTLALGDTALTNGLTSIFDNSWVGNPSVYSAHGGYVFGNSVDKIYLNYVGFEDLNVEGKARVNNGQCLPLVVATNSSWPVPNVRSLGTIAYNPTYATITR